jgi:hypothetical protein
MTKAASSAAHGTKANHLLGGKAIDSHRIFISTFIQHSTYAHFAVGDLLAGRFGAFSKTDDWTRVRKKALPIFFGQGFKDFTFDYYAATQCLVSRSGPTVEIFRGIPRNTAQLLFDDLARPGLTAHLFLDVLSSWSDQFGLAERFAARAGGAVVRLQLPVEMVFAHWLHDDLMEFILRRQCKQHLKSDPDVIGGEIVLWCPLRCIKVTQQDIAADFTQVPLKGTL